MKGWYILRDPDPYMGGLREYSYLNIYYELVFNGAYYGYLGHITVSKFHQNNIDFSSIKHQAYLSVRKEIINIKKWEF